SFFLFSDYLRFCCDSTSYLTLTLILTLTGVHCPSPQAHNHQRQDSSSCPPTLLVAPSWRLCAWVCPLTFL
ncbi:hypothetical protein BC939DRAFT_497712, partial [Gamsiella multidivaricata]|uniref:uncharacterized protein n=1 Tax=Gamsiella multidivaricata TaxID=101098 RepID=UPI00221E5603